MSIENNMKIIHNSIVRTMQMIANDFKAATNSKHFTDNVVRYVLWFEEKYKYKFRYNSNNLYVKKGEIYNCNFGENIGSEQNKWRPAIILQNNKGNLHSPTTIVAPITDEIKTNLPTHVDIKDLKPDSNIQGMILIEQLRCISKNRLSNRLDCVDTTSSNWNKIIKSIKIELDVSFNLQKY